MTRFLLGAAPHKKKEVSALTATAVVMRMHGDLRSLRDVFFVEPERIAGDIRRERLGKFFSTTAVQDLVQCLLNEPRHKNSQEFEVWAPNYLAAMNLLVAYQNRSSNRGMHHTVGQGPQGKFPKLFKFLEASEESRTADRPENPMFGAVKSAIAYGSMLGFVKDVAKHNSDNDRILTESIKAAGKVIGAATSALPAPGAAVLGAAVSGAADLAYTGVSAKLKDKEAPIEAAAKRVVRAFNSTVLAKARLGTLPGQNQRVSVAQGYEFAAIAASTLQALADDDGITLALKDAKPST